MLELALLASTTRPIAFFTILAAGVNIETPYLNHVWLGYFSLHQPSTPTLSESGTIMRKIGIDTLEDSKIKFFHKILADIPLISLPRDTLSHLLSEDKGTRPSSPSRFLTSRSHFFKLPKAPELTSALVSKSLRCIGAEDLKVLVTCGLSLSGEKGLLLLVEAARRDNFQAVHFLISRGVDINGTIRVQEIPWPVILLAITSWKTGESDLDLPAVSCSPSMDMLGFLLRQGANIALCSAVFGRPESKYKYYPGRITTRNVKWLLENGLDIAGESICRVIIRTLTLQGPHKEALEVFKLLELQGLPLFSPSEAQSYGKTWRSIIHPLSYLIDLNPGRLVLWEALEAGIPLDGHGLKDFKGLSKLLSKHKTLSS